MADDISMAQHYRQAIATVCEGFTLPDAARKVLETALWNPPMESATTGEPTSPTPAEVDAVTEGGGMDADAWAELHRLRAEAIESVSGLPWRQLAAQLRVERTTLARQLSDSEASRREAEASLAEAKAENERLMTIAGWGGLAGDAPERLILASEAYDDISCCDKWIDVRRVTDGEQPIPASATAYVRANLHEQAESQLAEATRRLGEVEGLVGKWRECAEDNAARGELIQAGKAVAYTDCADELEAALTKKE